MEEESLFEIALVWLFLGALFALGFMIKVLDLQNRVPADFEAGLYGIERVYPEHAEDTGAH